MRKATGSINVKLIRTTTHKTKNKKKRSKGACYCTAPDSLYRLLSFKACKRSEPVSPHARGCKELLRVSRYSSSKAAPCDYRCGKRWASEHPGRHGYHTLGSSWQWQHLPNDTKWQNVHSFLADINDCKCVNQAQREKQTQRFWTQMMAPYAIQTATWNKVRRASSKVPWLTYQL